MRETVDCVRNMEQQKHCEKDKTGQLVFNDIRDLLFIEEMKLIRHVFKEKDIRRLLFRTEPSSKRTRNRC